MKVVFIMGSTAVGKMTVGQQLAQLTNMRLCHNHTVIEPVLEVFGEFRIDVITEIREVIYRHFATTDNVGMIITFIYQFDTPDDSHYLKSVQDTFLAGNSETQFFYVELVADTAVRQQRNTTENRLKHKASKRDIALSQALFAKAESGQHRYISYDGEVTWQNYIKIDNTNLSPQEVASIIQQTFDL